MMATDHAQQAARADTVAALREVQQQLIRIHYPLASALAVDIELQRRTLQRLMTLMEYVDDAITAQTSHA